MKIFIIYSAVLFSFQFAVAQQVSNIRIEQETKKVNIYYDLSGQGEFDVSLFYSHDGGVAWLGPLVHLRGAAGQGQRAGNGKKIIWDVLQEVEKLQGDIRFKIEAIEIGLYGSSGTFTDQRDGKTYKWVKIGEQVWMAGNLNYATGSGSWCYDDKSSNCEVYGRLYNWEAALKVCPQGWHLPYDLEWTALTNFLGGYNAGGRLKEPGTTHWRSPNKGGGNSSGLNALPGGYRDRYGQFVYMGIYGHYWSATESEAAFAWSRVLTYDSAMVTRSYGDKEGGSSVRCIKDL
jgi:uncharacterized protein (TIGR02145 family)